MSILKLRSIRLVLPVFMLMFSFCVQAQFRGADRAKLVVVEPLSFEYETSLIEAVGTAQAKRSITLFPSVSDEVSAVNFRPGELVKQGDVLVELDSRLQDVAVDRAQIELNDAQRNYERIKVSVARGAVTERELDDADTLVKLAQVNLREANENKEDRLVRAPFAGVVGLTDVEVGDRINEQTIITSLDERQELFVNFVAPELAVSYLMERPDVQLQPWTNRDISLTARISEVDSRVNSEDRTIRARALLNNDSDQYRPGMSFRVSIMLRGERYVAIPEAALSWGTTGAYVWLAEDQTAKRVDVQVQQRLRGRILVSGELRDSELIIIEGIQGLRDGQALTIQNEHQLKETGSRLSKKPRLSEVAG